MPKGTEGTLHGATDRYIRTTRRRHEEIQGPRGEGQGNIHKDFPKWQREMRTLDEFDRERKAGTAAQYATRRQRQFEDISPRQRAEGEPLVPVGVNHPSSGRPIYNYQGDFATEALITVTDKRINDGAPTNIPSIWDGQVMENQSEAVRAALSSGLRFPSFPSIEMAVEAAQDRSGELGQAMAEWLSETPTGD